MTRLLVVCTTVTLFVTAAIAPNTISAQQQRTITYQEAIGTAQQLIDTGRFEDAIGLLNIIPERVGNRLEVLFLRGLAAIEAGVRAEDRETGEQLFEAAVEDLFQVVADDPTLLRPRLELARAYFLQGNDSAATKHFELVLAAEPPDPVVSNINRFLSIMRARRRLTGYFGFAFAPDTNISGRSESREVIIWGLPFVLEEPVEVTTGIGLSVWGGAEYRHTVVPHEFSIRFGTSASITDYAGGDYDGVSLEFFAGPEWQLSPISEVSAVSFLGYRWNGGEISHGDLGVRVNWARLISPKHRLRGEIAVYDRAFHDPDSHDGNGIRTRLGFGSDYRINPTTQLSLTFTRSLADADGEDDSTRETRLGAELQFALKNGYDLSFGASYTNTRFDGTGGGVFYPDVPPGELRDDRLTSLSVGLSNRNWRFAGFSPKLSVTSYKRSSNVQLVGYERTRAEVSLVQHY